MTITPSNYWTHPGVSQSQLRDFARSPMHYHARHVARTAEVAETAAMRFGTALHTAVLEPDVYASRYVTRTWDARTKEGKAARDAATARGLIALDDDDADKIASMVASLTAHPLASRILASRTHVEHPIAWECPTTGAACKGRPDAHVTIDGRSALVDVKTTEDASPASFARSIATYAYHIQAAHYLAGWCEVMAPVDAFVFIAIEKSAPYAVGVYELSESTLATGDERRIDLLTRLAECRTADRWPGYEAQTIDLPAWAR